VIADIVNRTNSNVETLRQPRRRSQVLYHHDTVIVTGKSDKDEEAEAA
jgi:hypothetical protein